MPTPARNRDIATVSSKGQITIPKRLRDDLGIVAGDELRIVSGPDGRMIITPRNIDLEDLFGSVVSPHEHPLTIEELADAAADGWAFGEPDEPATAGGSAHARSA